MKQFYFGMETTNVQQPDSGVVTNGDTNEIIDKFAANIRKAKQITTNTSPSESFNSDPINDDVSGMAILFAPFWGKNEIGA